MTCLTQADWIAPAESYGDVCPVFRKRFTPAQPWTRASLQITALGVYEARLNGQRVGRFVLAPGWTAYARRLQVQTYDVAGFLRPGVNTLEITVGKGWFRSPMPGWITEARRGELAALPAGLIAALEIASADGAVLRVATDETWETAESPVRFSEIYDGEHYNSTFVPTRWTAARRIDWPKEILIPQEGEEIREAERIAAKAILHTPAGETVVDFGQEITGYVELRLKAAAGSRVRILHGEMLDRDGNFFNANYRRAKAELRYICREGEQTWHPVLTFFGFRYLKLAEFPGEPDCSCFTAVVLCSDLRQTGFAASGVPELNRLFSNILWGQKGNFLDVPTDCPQRDERLGWTGDAQVFARAACLNYDTERFFRKWLRDLAAEQKPDGMVPHVVPDVMPGDTCSAGWGDAAVIIPWQVYQTYGDPAVLADQFDSMRRWVDHVTSVTTTPDLWTGHFHFGDWLALDAPEGSREGASDKDFIASVYYLNAARLTVKAGRVLGKDISGYEALAQRQLAAIRAAWPAYRTQTEHVLAVYFGIAKDCQAASDALAALIHRDGDQLKTGFIGTPYLLHALSRYGHAGQAWTLLLRKAYPSWLYAVGKGATTIWEHWDGVRPDGSFWSDSMNSFNHYAYGAAADWIYEQAAGIRHPEDAPGYAKALIEPHPDRRAGRLDVTLRTRSGIIRSQWTCLPDDSVRYEIRADMPALIRIGGRETDVPPGTYTFWG